MTSIRGKLGVSRSRKKKVKQISEMETLKDRLHLMESVLSQTIAPKLHGRIKVISKSEKSQLIRKFLSNDSHHFEIRDKAKIEKYTNNIVEQMIKLEKEKLKQRDARRNVKSMQELDLNRECSSNKDDDCHSREEDLPKINLNDPKTDPWALINIMNTIDAEEGIQKDHLKIVRSQKSMASNLNEQLKEKKHIQEVEASEKRKYVEEQKRKLIEWEKEQELAEKLVRQNIELTRKERQEQIEQRKLQRKQEAKELRDAELERMEVIKRELQDAEDQRVKKIMDERKRLEGVKQENIENEKIKKKMREEEALLDARLMKEYKERVDREEQQRIDAFNARLARYEKIALQREEAGFNKMERERILKIERKILQEALAKEKADDEKERRAKELKVQKQKKISETNKQMSDDKARMRQLEKHADEKFAISYRKEIEKIVQEEKLKVRQRKDLDKKHCILLQEQIKTMAEANEEHMTSTEKSINREVMMRIENDPVIRRKISERIAEQEKLRKRNESADVE